VILTSALALAGYLRTCIPEKTLPCWKIKPAIRLNDASGWLLGCALKNLTHEE
jgi:hypothetical protein